METSPRQLARLITPGRLVVATLYVALLGAACAGELARCSDVPLAPSAERELAEAAATLDFEPRVPCTYRSGFSVRRVFADVLPGDPPQPRLNFSVERGRDRAFILSETRALLPFSAIPQGTHWLQASADGVTAAGFAGPSGSGEDLAYLRWRVDGVTFELAATLYPWLTEQDVQAIAEALMMRKPASESRRVDSPFEQHAVPRTRARTGRPRASLP